MEGRKRKGGRVPFMLEVGYIQKNCGLMECILIFQISNNHKFLNKMIFIGFDSPSVQLQQPLHQLQYVPRSNSNFDSNHFLDVLSYALQNSLQSYSKSLSDSPAVTAASQQNLDRYQSSEKASVSVVLNNFSVQNKQQGTPKKGNPLSDQIQIKRCVQTLSPKVEDGIKLHPQQNSQDTPKQKKEQRKSFKIKVSSFRRQPRRIISRSEGKDEQVLMPYKNPKTCILFKLPKLGCVTNQAIKNRKRKLLRKKVNDWLLLEEKAPKRSRQAN